MIGIVKQEIERTIGLSLKDSISSNADEEIEINFQRGNPALIWVSNDDSALDINIEIEVSGKILNIPIKAQEQFEIPFMIERDEGESYTIKVTASTPYRIQIYSI